MKTSGCMCSLSSICALFRFVEYMAHECVSRYSNDDAYCVIGDSPIYSFVRSFIRVPTGISNAYENECNADETAVAAAVCRCDSEQARSTLRILLKINLQNRNIKLNEVKK